MLDYDLKLEGLDEKGLDQELNRLIDRLSTMNPQSGTYQQLLAMYQMAQQRQQELLMLVNKPSDQVIDLGTVDESVYYPDYSRKELLDATVTHYLGASHEPKQSNP